MKIAFLISLLLSISCEINNDDINWKYAEKKWLEADRIESSITGASIPEREVNVLDYNIFQNGEKLNKGAAVCSWDPFNGVIVSEFTGQIVFENIEQGETYQVEIDEQTGFQEKVISESRNKKLIPTLSIIDKSSKTLRSYNLPVGAHLIVNEGEQIDEGKILVKIPRKSAKSGDINDNQSSQISVELDVVMDGDIKFFYKVASEYSTSG